MTTHDSEADDRVTIPVRLDIDTFAPSFTAEMSHLDKAATKELDRVGFDARLRELVRTRLPAQWLCLLR